MQKKIFISLVIGLTYLLGLQTIHAQATDWQDYVEQTYVFKISNKEAYKLLKGKIDKNKLFHTPEGYFTKEWTNAPKQGHFILADIKKDEVNCYYTPVMPFQVFLFKEYGALTLQVVDSMGNVRSDAKVKINSGWRLLDTRVSFDDESKTYTIKEDSDNEYRLLTVELDKFRAVFDLNKHLVYPWYNNYHGSNGPEFYSYMITDKNKYKPEETLKFKSYALTRSKRPIKKELDLWINTGQDHKKIKSVIPYGPGGFAGELELHDSLKLKLDKSYNIQLKDKNNRIVASTNFRYEDYQLFDSKLCIDVKHNTHYYPDTNQIEIKAIDANGLYMPDVKADVVIKRKNVKEVYVDVLSIPDTILFQNISLKNDSPTFFDLPAELFGNADLDYQVEVKLKTIDNQARIETKNVAYFRSNHNIIYKTKNDTIRFSYFEQGKEKGIKAELRYDDSEETKQIELPYEEVFEQNLKSYTFLIPEINYEKKISIASINPQLKVKGEITGYDMELKLINPLHLDVSWYVYQGSTLIENGFGKDFDLTYNDIDLNETQYVEVFYYMGNQEKMYRNAFVSKAKHLDIDVDLPEQVYPGQQIDATITVKDHYGNPARNVDLTAFAFNSQLNYHVPDLPYYGQTPRSRNSRDSYSVRKKKYDFKMPLNYDFWNKLAQLDTIKYYQLTYPGNNKMFIHTVNTPDSITQFAPFVTNNGKAVNIHVIELNGVPVYFSWTNQLKAYSFPVSDTIKYKMVLRMSNKALILDSISFEKGKKTFLSIDMLHLPKQVKVLNLESKLTKHEGNIYNNYISRIPVADQEYTYLMQNGKCYPVYHKYLQNYRNKDVLVGPFPPGKASYLDSFEYKHEGAFSYQFEDNVVYKESQNVLPDYLHYNYTNNFNLTDFYLSPKVLAEKIRKSIARPNWYPQHIQIQLQNMLLNFRLPVNRDSVGVSNLLLQNKNGEIFFDHHNGFFYTNLVPDVYDVILLYNNGKYIKCENLCFKANNYTDINLNNLPCYDADSVSEKWLDLDTPIKEIPKERLRTIYEFPTIDRDANNLVRGYVYDEFGETLIGVSVCFEDDPTQGTITNLDGYFQIPVSNKGALIFSYVGYKKEKLDIIANSEVYVILKNNPIVTREVTAIGYGSMSTRDMTGTLTSGYRSNSGKPEDFENEDDENIDATEILYRELLQINGLRSNFSDVAFWQPALRTDKKGQATFSTTFPDNITKWETVIYGMDRRLQTGMCKQSVKSYKPLMAELKIPQFLVEGDECYAGGYIRNYTQSDTIKGNVLFMINNDTLANKDVHFTSSWQEYMRIVAPHNTDSINAVYMFTHNDGYTDGEKRNIRIEKTGVEIAEGELHFLKNNETVKIKAKDDEQLFLKITGNPIDIYLQSTYYLTEYAHACNEQLASKLIGLLNLKLYMAYKEQAFKYDSNVNQIIRKLMNNQNKKKLWSWFGNSDQTSFWMSAHILHALKMAQDAGYKVNLDITNIKQDYMDLQTYRKPSLNDIQILHALSCWNVKQDYKTAVSMFSNRIKEEEAYIDSLNKVSETKCNDSFLKEKLLLWEICQQQNLVYSTDSIMKYLKKDVFGAIYCDDERHRDWYSDNLITTLIAYRIVRNDPALQYLKEPMQMYILGTKRYYWNTYQTASAISTVFPDLLSSSASEKKPATVQLNGKVNKIITEFPYEIQLERGEMLQFEKKDGVPLIYTAYSIKRLLTERDSETFEIETSFQGGDMLTAGVKTTLQATVKVKQKNVEYIMIEIPIPAGCTYASKPNSFINEVHREYFKEKVIIYCRNLPIGTHTFNVQLFPQYSGKYTLNPSKIEMMYFPVINANNDLRKIEISF